MKNQLKSKRATIDDIAKLANVSKSTVSRVINDTTPVHQAKREAVEAAMKALDFQPNFFAQSLAGGQSKTIGVLTHHLASPFYDTISQGVIAHLSDTGYWPLFSSGNGESLSAELAVKNFLTRKIDGLILIGGIVSEKQLIQFSASVPTFLAGLESQTLAGQSISVNNEAAAYDATKHLIDLGHRFIVHVTGVCNHKDAVRRLEGYRRALKESGIAFDPDLIFEGKFDGQSGHDAVMALIERGKKFTAVFAANDICAMGVMLALSQKSLSVPEDVSVIGFDGQNEAAFTVPPLTTVKQPAFEMGTAAAAAMVAMINQKPYALQKWSAEVTVGGSTGPAKITA